MYQATSRLSVLKFAAATSISLAAIATALPDVIGSLSDLATAAIPPNAGLTAAGGRGTLTESVTTVATAETPAVTPAPSTTSVEALPPAGWLAALQELTAPQDPTIPPLRFAARSSASTVENITFSTFRKAPPHMIVRRFARLPHAKPEHFSLASDDTSEDAIDANSAALAYAPQGPDLEAPFEVVMSGSHAAATEPEGGDDAFNRPRPRPDPSDVLSWLDGRALGQFAPGQHDWVQNPLPASVYDDAQQKCLAQGIYFEARGESDEGQAAVAQVILNRVRNPAYPKTICGVVYQNQKWRHHCQFSFACDGHPENISEAAAWKKAERIALDVTNGKLWVNEVADATHYHAGYVRTQWDRLMIEKDKLGQHIFYRTKNGGWS